MKVVEAAPSVGGLVRMLLIVFVVLVAGPLLLVWVVVRRPVLVIPAALFGCLVLVGLHDAEALVVYVLGGLWVWRRAHRDSFDRVIGRRVRGGWRRWRVYERGWRSTMRHCGLTGRGGRVREVVPEIDRVICDRWCDRVRVRLVRGQCTEDFERAAPGLAHAFGARSCRVREDRPGRLWLVFAVDDPLADPVPALAIDETVDLKAVPIGVREDGERWTVRVVGTHTLIAGATGAGKGSVLQSLIRGLAPEIRDGRVALWVIDPKTMELRPGRALYARFAVPTLDEHPYEDIARLLDDALDVMRQRSHDLGEQSVREHTPTTTEPLIVVLIDELADLTKYVNDRKTKERIARALGLLLTQGRALGISVIAALQDPRKEVCPDRNLFPNRIALRLDEPDQVELVLGEDARDRGALCDHIPESQPGIAYVRVESVREPTRVRAAYPTNKDIAQLAADYAPRRSLDGEALFQAAESDVDAEIIELPNTHDDDQTRGNDDTRQAS